MLVIPTPSKRSFSSLLELCSFRPKHHRFSKSTPRTLSSTSSKMTTSTNTTPSSSYNSSRENSIGIEFQQTPIKSQATQTIFERRQAASRINSHGSIRLQGYTDIFPPAPPPPTAVNSPSTKERLLKKIKKSDEIESDQECWERMLELQRLYHCYNSARLEAAVEALEKGWGIEKVPMPSRLCLDLLNEELRARVESHRHEILWEGL